ncbi:TadE family type IV pilus minor pilin [Microbacterium sp. zg.B48]|uniref:TadE family type IV pilus minor pilin n=1 Tax=Microbacterium sp. zg.B48 TaxID=2969408 RepID=UPI0027E32E9A|nr:TadE family type IV pilus minor pilin [Microbacterium sp. zg.B48]
MVAEFAVALPAVALVLLLGAGALGACARQVSLQDAAADAARLAARGEPDGAPGVVATAVPGAHVVIEARGDLVCVRVTAPAGHALPLILNATGCALDGGR